MKKIKSKKFKITAPLFIVAVFAGSFSFCLMFLSTAHASVHVAVSHDGCDENYADAAQTGGMERNSLMPCCVENGSAQKTYALRDAESYELNFFAVSYNENSQNIPPLAELQNRSILSFSSSPPGGEKLASVFKRE